MEISGVTCTTLVMGRLGGRCGVAWGEGKRQTGIPILVSKVALKKMTASLNLSFFLRKKRKRELQGPWKESRRAHCARHA